MILLASNAAAESIFAPHPAANVLDAIFPTPPASLPADFNASKLNRDDYLPVIAGIVDFFKASQNADGAIIDPVVKSEVQYSTPAFALAAAELAVHAKRDDLLDNATRAMTFATAALVQHRAANGHSDFYIPLLMHARDLLKDRSPKETVDQWDAQFRSIEPTKIYRMDLRNMNWNVVSTSGELLRRKAGLVPAEMAEAQMKYLEACLVNQQKNLTTLGLYNDPKAPLAYDEFSRLWLGDVMAAGGYEGPMAAKLRVFLRTGALSTLLLLSPNGEWASGGRSAFHQWNEAETAAICEMNAIAWQREGRPDVAGAFKRAAHLSLQSITRWRRPSGELFIVKNRGEPGERFGFESYSQHSQYNLLAAAMLAMAHDRADDSIAEAPLPAEAAAYVFDARETFHKIVAAAGGYYVLIDTAGDPHYNATGLQRVMRAGVALSPLSDSTAAERAYGPAGGGKAAMSPELMWKDSADGAWQSLASPGKANAVKEVSLKIDAADSGVVRFGITYTLGDSGRKLIEAYTISAAGVEVTDRLEGGEEPTACALLFPALVSDGLEKTKVTLATSRLEIAWRASVLTADCLNANSGGWELSGPAVVCHNGDMRAAVCRLRTNREVRWKVTLGAEVPR